VKKMCLVGLLIMLITFSSCVGSNNEVITGTPNNSLESSSVISEAFPEIAEPDVLENDKNKAPDDDVIFKTIDDYMSVEFTDIERKGYTIEPLRHTVNDDVKENYIDIIYPQLDNMEDKEVQEKINRILMDTAFGSLSIEGYDAQEVEQKVAYEVTWAGDNFLSVKFYTWCYIGRAAHDNNFLQGVNIYIRTGEMLKLTDFFDISYEFVEKFKTRAIMDSEKYHISPNAYWYVSHYYDDVDLKDILLSADVHTGLFPASDYSSYFTDNTVGVSFATVKSAGEYAEIVISYDDVRDDMKADNDMWNELLT